MNSLHQDTCSIVFRGDTRDLLLLRLSSLVLLGANCSSSLRLSVQDHAAANNLRAVATFCSPLEDHTDPFPIIINSTLVFLDFKTDRKEDNSFSGAYSFHNSEFPQACLSILTLPSHSPRAASPQHLL